jgi:hypothetical protein
MCRRLHDTSSDLSVRSLRGSGFSAEPLDSFGGRRGHRISGCDIAWEASSLKPGIRSPNQMSTNEDLARLHLETAVRLTSRAFVEAWTASKAIADTSQSTTAAPTQAPPTQPKSTRGRKPGAAPTETRCAWNKDNGIEHQCKNTRHEGNSYCRIHLGKIHLIDPTQ